MTLKLYFHPLSSFCWKALIALYENDIPFEPILVDLRDEKSRDDFLKVWPMGKFPVIRDETRNRTIPESSMIIEYLGQHYPGKVKLLPSDPDLARQTRFYDRFYDLYIHEPMQKIVGDRLRPADKKDPFGVEQAKTRMETALGMVDQELKGKTWTMGAAFSMADCAASPALYYGDKVVPLSGKFPNVVAYLDRLKARPAFARVLQEAEPYFKFFPSE